jgi:hypothetical protein
MKVFEVLQPYLDREVTPYCPWMLKTYREVQEYLQGLKLFDNDKAKINPRNLEVSCHDSIFVKPKGSFGPTIDSFFIEKNGYHILPVKWAHINTFQIPAGVRLKDFAGFPDTVNTLSLDEAEIEDFDEFPQIIHEDLNFYVKGYKPFDISHVSCKNFVYGVTDQSDIPTLEGGPQDVRSMFAGGNSINFKKVGKFYPHVRQFTFYFKESTGLLSFLLCPELIAVGPGPGIDKEEPMVRAGEACSIIVKHLHKEKDVLDCKAELIEAKLEEFAKL